MGIAGVLGAVGLALVIPAGASAANIDCNGHIVPQEGSNGKAYTYDFLCGSITGDATTIDGYSIVSNMKIAGFGPDAIVTDSAGQPAKGESFACEGPIPSDGFGCFGKASLYNSIEGGFSTLSNPCTKRNIRNKDRWKIWVIASANKIDPNTGKKTPAVSEPLRMRAPKCADATPTGGKRG